MAKQLTHTGEQLDAAIDKVRTTYADVSGTTVQPADVVAGKKYVATNKVLTTGTMPDVAPAPSVDIESDYLSDAASGYPVAITPKATIGATGRAAAGTITGTQATKYIKVTPYSIDANGTYIPPTGKLISSVTAAIYRSGLQGGRSVTFWANGSPYYFASAQPGKSITAPPRPVIVGYHFVGWYTEAHGQGTEVTFPFTPTETTTNIYAYLTDEIVVGITNLNSGTLTLTDMIADVDMWHTETNGNYVSVVNPLDDYFPFNEITEATDANGNVFVKFPKMWMKWVRDIEGIIGVKFANYQVDSSYFISDAYLDPSDTTNYLNFFALGKYEASGDSTRVFSKSGETPSIMKLTNIRAACRSYGDAANCYNGYQSMDIQQLTIYNILCMMYYRTTNIQSVYAGNTNGSTSNTGSTDGCVGMNGWNTSTKCVKMLGVENPYGNTPKWVDGLEIIRHDPSGSSWYAEIPIIRNPVNYGDSTGAPSLEITSALGWVVTLGAFSGTDARRSVMFPVAFSTASTTRFGDRTSFSSSGGVSAGGRSSSGNEAGLWCMQSNGTNITLGGRLAYRPAQ